MVDNLERKGGRHDTSKLNVNNAEWFKTRKHWQTTHQFLEFYAETFEIKFNIPLIFWNIKTLFIQFSGFIGAKFALYFIRDV